MQMDVEMKDDKPSELSFVVKPFMTEKKEEQMK